MSGSAVRLEPPFCLVCCQPGRLKIRLCPRCWERLLQIDSIRAPYRLEGSVREAVYALKYRGVRALAATVGELLAQFVDASTPSADLLVPVPLHPKREKRRGYNQSMLLAQATGDLLGLPTEAGALRRLRQTPSQAGSASQEERLANVAGAFWAEPLVVKGKRVVVVDDVCTTGATLEACAVALREAGATSVAGLTMAREA